MQPRFLPLHTGIFSNVCKIHSNRSNVGYACHPREETGSKGNKFGDTWESTDLANCIWSVLQAAKQGQTADIQHEGAPSYMVYMVDKATSRSFLVNAQHHSTSVFTSSHYSTSCVDRWFPCQCPVLGLMQVHCLRQGLQLPVGPHMR